MDALAAAVQDLALDVPQLMKLGSHAELATERSTLPHAVNVQDKEGNTVLHHCAKEVLSAGTHTRCQ